MFDVYDASIDDITTHDFESTLRRAAQFNTEKTASKIVDMLDNQNGRELDTDARASLVKLAIDITASEVLQDTIDEIG